MCGPKTYCYKGDFEKYVDYYPQTKIYPKNFRMGSTFWKVQKNILQILKNMAFLKEGGYPSQKNRFGIFERGYS